MKLDNAFPEGLSTRSTPRCEAPAKMETARRPVDPLLVSVRSGAPFSMRG